MSNTFSSNFIPLEQAIIMTKRYRDNREPILKTEYQGQAILPVCESFGREGFDTLLAKGGCAGLRVYYGMDELFKTHAIIVAVNASGEDMIPSSPGFTNLQTDGNGDEDILDDAMRCPTLCPPPSPLNEP